MRLTEVKLIAVKLQLNSGIKITGFSRHMVKFKMPAKKEALIKTL